MGYLVIGQTLEIITSLILVVLVAMLIRFGQYKYLTNMLFGFFAYLLAVILSLTVTLYELSNAYLVIFSILIISSYFLARSVILYTKPAIPMLVNILYVLTFAGAIALMYRFNETPNAEGYAYIFLGLTYIFLGYNWITNAHDNRTADKVVGVLFILHGLHLMDFLIFKYEGDLLIIGYLVAATFELLIAGAIVLTYFTHLNDENLRHTEQYQNLFKHASDPILIIQDEQIIDCNEKACDLFGLSREQVLKNTPMMLSPDYQDNGRSSDEYGKELFSKAFSGQYTYFSWNHSTNDGVLIPCEISLFLIDEATFAAIIRDMTEKSRYEEQLDFYRYYDLLTKLPLRELFIDRLSQNLEADYEKVALVAVNIDQFKQINDEYGHKIGDELLIEVAKRLKNSYTFDVTITRLGADEFIILLNRLENRNLIYLHIDRIEASLSQPFHLSGTTIKITACKGIAYAESETMDPSTLLSNVDLALNIAKKNGRSSIEFYSTLGKEEFRSRISMEREIEKGISGNEFIPFYQPIVMTDSSEIVGAEALMRWIKPNGEIVSPGRFIPIAEETGLIDTLGPIILDHACRDCKKILDNHPTFVMHVNFSPKQMASPDIVRIISQALEKHDLPARHLDIEITESSFIEDESRINQVLEDIRNLGVQVSLDDFGTGYSSLSYLNKMSVDTIKIDRSFVLQIPKKKRPSSMLKSLSELIHNLDLQIIVEGVEELDQVEFIRQIRCDMIQGFYFHKPMPYDRLIKTLD